MAYDPTSGRVILFGGGDGEAEYNDTWAYALVENTLTELHPAGDLPRVRRFHAMVYDPDNGQVILFGGVSEQEPLSDTWAYDPVANRWAELKPGGEVPSPRAFHSLVLEPTSGKILLFEGGDETGDMNDVWEYDSVTNAWSELNPEGPPPTGRGGLSTVWDPVEDRIIVFGGRSAEFFNDLWTYDYAGNVWAEVESTEDVPTPRGYQAMVYDIAGGRALLFGGGTDEGGLNDTWAYDPAGNTWTELEPEGRQPSERIFHAMVYHDASGRVVMFGGGNDQGEFLSDTWVYDSLAADSGVVESPAARSFPSLVFDSAEGRALLFGGGTDDEQYEDTWAYESVTDTWTRIDPVGRSPSGRLYQSMIFHQAEGTAVLFGGATEGGLVNDTWAYNPARNTWTELEPIGDLPLARMFHALVYDPTTERALLFGGRTDDGLMNDIWAYDSARNTWTDLQPEGEVPSARGFHSLVFEPGSRKVILFGGEDGEGGLNDTWTYDPETNVWTELYAAGELPSQRSGHTMIFEPESGVVLLFGGHDWETDAGLNDMWAYDPAANTWIAVDSRGEPPPARDSHALVYDTETLKMMLFGGWDGWSDLGDTWIYDPKAGIWTESLTSRAE
jgi:N-acetylneuraminic acid mutarotase